MGAKSTTTSNHPSTPGFAGRLNQEDYKIYANSEQLPLKSVGAIENDVSV